MNANPEHSPAASVIPPSFNNQKIRQGIFLDLIRVCKCSAIAETGTNKGATTLWMHEKSQCPVFTCELNPDRYNGNKKKFGSYPDIHAYNEDSRLFLMRLIKDGKHERVFYYLDAHGRGDLPLAEELSALSSVHEAIIMIDDFQVPGDSGYHYSEYYRRKTIYVSKSFPYLQCRYEDLSAKEKFLNKLLRWLEFGRGDSGKSRSLTINIIPDDMRRTHAVYFPAAPSAEESGAKRGCIILASAAMVPMVDSLKCLRRHNNRD